MFKCVTKPTSSCGLTAKVIDRRRKRVKRIKSSEEMKGRKEDEVKNNNKE